MSKKKPGRRRPRTEIGMRPYADRVEETLKVHGALPRFKQDLSVIDDLARLAWHVPVLSQSLRDLVATRGKGAGEKPLEERIRAVASDVERVHGLCRTVRGPLRRLLKVRTRTTRGAGEDGRGAVPFADRSRRRTENDPRPGDP
jgi:hypothetical protein